MSEDAPGTIKYLVDLARPKIGVITFIGDPPVHLKYYKNINHFIEEISYLPQRLLLDGKFIFNIDNHSVLGLKEKTMAKTFSYGFDERADVKISNYKLVTVGNDLRKAGMSFRIEYKGSFVPVKLKGVIGKPQSYALAAAAAVGLALEMNLVEIAEAMKDYQIPIGRTKFISGIKDSWVLDDTYNACPDSVLAALDLIKEINAKRRIVILGDMKELGDFSKQAHGLIGGKVSEIADIFIAVGKEMMLAKDNVIEKNSEIEVFWFENSEEAKKNIKKMVQKGDLILVKGSRAMEMEKITKEIST
jgi:UDP-N-acetylmuramoyl-tripeptide--D-alanyl-D-alanine ligase